VNRRSDDKLIQSGKQRALSLLQKLYGLGPVFCSDIETEQDANAQADAPLLFAWIKQDGLTESLNVSINRGKVADVIQTFVPSADPLFEKILTSLCDDLLAASREALSETMRLTGASAQDICAAAGGKPKG
jgi:hypothetical protein